MKTMATPNTTLASQLAPFVERFRRSPSPEVFTTGPRPSAPTGGTEPNAFTLAVLQQLHQDLADWEASARGKDVLGQLPHLGLGGRVKALKEVIRCGALDRTISLVRTNPDRTAEQTINALSIAWEFNVALLWEGSLAVGVAFDPFDPLGLYTVWVCLGAAAGEAGVSTGTQGGVWTCTPEGVGGLSFGVQGTVEYGPGGATLAVSVGSSGVGFLLTIGVGLQVGAAPSGWYTMILFDSAYDRPPFYQDDAEHLLILTKLECENIAGGDGDHNEVYFNFSANDVYWHRYPQWSYFPMAEGDTWNCGRSVKLQDWVDVYLYDVDDTSGDDLLGNARINRSQLTVGQEVQFTLTSKNGLDERLYYIYAELIY
jgi:hypothetical protein